MSKKFQKGEPTVNDVALAAIIILNSTEEEYKLLELEPHEAAAVLIVASSFYLEREEYEICQRIKDFLQRPEFKNVKLDVND